MPGQAGSSWRDGSAIMCEYSAIVLIKEVPCRFPSVLSACRTSASRTLFTALTNKGGLAANYPFATIEPNVGVVPVPDARLQDRLAEDRPSGASIVPATVEFVDIAGLVAGASQGEGLGNQFLANIRETDAICEVVRFFGDPDVEHVSRQGRPAKRRGNHQDRADPGRHGHAGEGAATSGEGGQARQGRRGRRSSCGEEGATRA